jgi:streptogramin lyase
MVKKFTTDGQPLAKWDLGNRSQPMGLAVDSSGNTFVADQIGVKKLSPQGQLLMDLGDPLGGDQPGHFSLATGVAVDLNGNLWVADSGNNRLEMLPADAMSAVVALPNSARAGSRTRIDVKVVA